jgi:ABC-type nickel/cobalt efflux system permease component RcnA
VFYVQTEKKEKDEGDSETEPVEKVKEEEENTSSPGQHNDLLSLLLKSRAEDARHSLTDEEIFSDSFIFLLAGSFPIHRGLASHNRSCHTHTHTHTHNHVTDACVHVRAHGLMATTGHEVRWPSAWIGVCLLLE